MGIRAGAGIEERLSSIGGEGGRVARRSFCAALLAAGWMGDARADSPARQVPVLVYHRFAPTVEDGMTVRLATFERHLRVLQQARCRVVPLADVVAWRQGLLDTLPPRAVALTADDGHRSQAERMAPMLSDTGWPVTLFVYPSAVSNASYAMSWEQLAALQASGTYRIESHTYWHPNLVRERQRLFADAFDAFATDQLVRSRQRLQDKLGVRPSLLAWPFGMTDAGLMALAERVGYEASFTLGNRHLGRLDPLHALPRHLVTDALDGPRLARLLEDAFAHDPHP